MTKIHSVRCAVKCPDLQKSRCTGGSFVLRSIMQESEVHLMVVFWIYKSLIDITITVCGESIKTPRGSDVNVILSVMIASTNGTLNVFGLRRMIEIFIIWFSRSEGKTIRIMIRLGVARATERNDLINSDWDLFSLFRPRLCRDWKYSDQTILWWR